MYNYIFYSIWQPVATADIEYLYFLAIKRKNIGDLKIRFVGVWVRSCGCVSWWKGNNTEQDGQLGQALVLDIQ